MRDDKIIKQLQAGEPSGLEALMEIYLPYVSAVVWNILKSGGMTPEDAEETVSDVFLTAWQHARELTDGKVKAWLGAVARNHAKNRLRERRDGLFLMDDVMELPDPEDLILSLEREERARLVRVAVESLEPLDREIFLRYYYELQPLGEISAVVGVNENTVKSRLRRGRMKLKTFFTREGFDDTSVF